MEPVILYEDNHLLFVDKPPGLLTQPSGTDQESLEALCKDFLKKRDSKPGNVYLHAVHRLDKPVGGVVVFAKSSKALSRLNASLRNKKVKKQYEALIEGTFANRSETLQHFLLHDSHKARVVDRGMEGAKLATLHYEVIEEHGDVSRVAIELETGRYHQIRVQFSHEGHPVVGDEKYGAKTFYADQGIALIHKKLAITHPVTGEVLEITSQYANSLRFHIDS